jgi:hypothetical protein
VLECPPFPQIPTPAQRRVLRSVPLRVVLIATLAAVVVAGIGLVSYRSLRPVAASAYALVDESTLMVLKGQVQLVRAGSAATNILADSVVRVGDRLTVGPDSYAVITFFDGSTTELEPGTIIEVRHLDRSAGGGQQISFHQEAGKTWNRVEKLIDATSRFETTTASSVAFVRGTEYVVEIDAEQQTIVQAITDTVVVQAVVNGQIQEVVLEPGFQTEVTPGSSPSSAHPNVMPPNGLRVEIQGPVRPFLTDDRNRSMGFHPQADLYTGQIPAGTYAFGADRQSFLVPDPVQSYELALKGQSNGSFSVNITVLVDGRPVASARLVPGLAAPLDQGGTGTVGGTIRTGQVESMRFSISGTNLQLGTFNDLDGAPSGSRAAFARSQVGQATPTSTQASAPPTVTRTSPPAPPASTQTLTPIPPSPVPPTLVPPTATDAPALPSPTLAPVPTTTLALAPSGPGLAPPAPGLVVGTATQTGTVSPSPTRSITSTIPPTTPSTIPSPSGTVTPAPATVTLVPVTATQVVPPEPETATPTLEPLTGTTPSSTSTPEPSASPRDETTATPSLTLVIARERGDNSGPNRTATSTLVPTLSPTAVPSASLTSRPSVTLTAAQPTESPVRTSTVRATATITLTPGPTSTGTITPVPTLTGTSTISPTITRTGTATSTPTITLTITLTSTATPSLTPSATFTVTATPTLSPTATPTSSPSVTLTPAGTATHTLTASATATASLSPSSSPTITETATATITPTATVTATVTITATGTPNGAYWIAPVSGDWSDATKWSTNPSLPGPTDDVFINHSGITVSVSSGTHSVKSLFSQASVTISGGTLNLAQASTIGGSFGGSFTLSSGTLGGAGTLDINGIFDWSGGTMGGGGITNANAGATITGAANKTITGRTLNIGSGTTVTCCGSGNIVNGSGAVINNAGTFNVTSNATFSISGVVTGGTFSNALSGHFISDTATVTFQNGWSFNTTNSGGLGGVHVKQGVLTLTSGQASAGAFLIDDNAALTLVAYTALNGTAFDYDPVNTGFPNGELKITGATNFSGSVTVNGPLTIDTGATLTVASGTTDALHVTSLAGTLTGAGSFKSGGSDSAFMWQGGGAMSGGGTTIVGQELVTAGTGAVFIDQRTLILDGDSSWDNDVNASNGARINNSFGSIATLNAGTSTRTFTSGVGAVPAFVNSGKLQKDNAAGLAAFANQFAFSNQNGTVDVSNGELKLTNGLIHSGSFSADVAGTLSIAGAHAFPGDFTTSGVGTLVLAAGTLEINGNASFSTKLSLTSGMLFLATGGTATTAQPVTMSGGTLRLANSRELKVQSTSAWTGGTMEGFGGGNQITVDTTGSMTISGVSPKNISNLTLNNKKTITWSDGAVTALDIVIDNQNGGLLNLTGPVTLASTGAFDRIENRSGAEIRRSGAAGTATLGLRINSVGSTNTGKIDVQGHATIHRTLALTGPGVHDNAAINVGQNATFSLGGSHRFTNIATINDALGTIDVNGGINEFWGLMVIKPVLNINNGGTAVFENTAGNSVTADNVVTLNTGGTLAGSGELVFNNNFTWNGGTMSGSGQVTRGTGSMTITTTAQKTLAGRKILTNGALLWNGGNIGANTCGRIHILGGGTFTIQDDLTLSQGSDASCGPSLSRVDVDAGASLIKNTSDGIATIEVLANLSGDVTVQPGASLGKGTLRLTGGGFQQGIFTASFDTALEFAGSHSFNNGSKLLGNGIHIASNAAPVAGTLTFENGATIGGAFDTPTLQIQSGATATFNTGSTVGVGSSLVTVEVLSGGTLNVSADNSWLGDLSNAGTVNLSDPTATVGHLDVSGTYTQTATGNLVINLDGVGSCVPDLLTANAFNLAGTLTVTQTNGCVLPSGNQVVIMSTSSRTGTFTTTSLPNATPGYTVDYVLASGVTPEVHIRRL